MRARGGIVVVVAHRPSALAGVDLVLMMAEGRVQAFGPKDEVLAKVLRPVPVAPPTPGCRACRSRAMSADREHARRVRRIPPMSQPVLRSAALDPAPPRGRRRPGRSSGRRRWRLGGDHEIAGAVIAPGELVVDSNVKKVQHPTGGVVGELRVRDGDRVKAGDMVVRLDETRHAGQPRHRRQGPRRAARRARRGSRPSGTARQTIAFPAELAQRADDPTSPHVIAGEQKLFEIRRAARKGQKAQLRERVGQLDEEIRGLDRRRSRPRSARSS